MFHRATIYERPSEYELIENVEQVKLKNQKQSDIKVSLDLKIDFIYTVYSYSVKKILHLNFCCIFLPQKSKLYSEHLVIADNLLQLNESNQFFYWKNQYFYWKKSSETPEKHKIAFSLKTTVC